MAEMKMITTMKNLGWRFRPGCHWPDGGGRKRLNMHSDHLDHHHFDHHHHVPNHQQQHHGYCDHWWFIEATCGMEDLEGPRMPRPRRWREFVREWGWECILIRFETSSLVLDIWFFCLRISSSVELTLGLLKAWLLSESHWKLGREHSKEWTDEDENFNFWVIRWQW